MFDGSSRASGHLELVAVDGEFELDECPFVGSALQTPTVVGVFDPGDDCEKQFVTRHPEVSVEDVLLQQGGERFQRRVVAGGGDATHNSRQIVGLEHGDDSSCPELGPPVRRNNYGPDP